VRLKLKEGVMYLSGVLKREYVILEYPEVFHTQQAAAACLAQLETVQESPTDNTPPALMQVPDEGYSLRSVKNQEEDLLNKARAEGWQEGFDEGYQIGMEESETLKKEKLQQINMELENKCKSLTSENQQSCEHLRDGQASRGLKYAAKILYYEIENNESAFLRLFENAASHITETDSAILKVGPRGYEIALRHAKELEKSIHGVKKFEIQLIGSNNGLCIIETSCGSLDASIDTQLKKAARTIGVPFESLES
jgi:flagellar biosynthesis/type III secretory pathway protein FliH